jgi:hypothetical protein
MVMEFILLKYVVDWKAFLFTSKAQRTPRKSVLFNPVRGGIERKPNDLQPKYLKGNASFSLSVLSTERKKYFFFAPFAPLR